MASSISDGLALPGELAAGTGAPRWASLSGLAVVLTAVSLLAALHPSLPTLAAPPAPIAISAPGSSLLGTLLPRQTARQPAVGRPAPAPLQLVVEAPTQTVRIINADLWVPAPAVTTQVAGPGPAPAPAPVSVAVAHGSVPRPTAPDQPPVAVAVAAPERPTTAAPVGIATSPAGSPAGSPVTSPVTSPGTSLATSPTGSSAGEAPGGANGPGPAPTDTDTDKGASSGTGSDNVAHRTERQVNGEQLRD